MIIMNDDTIIRLAVFITVATDPIIVDIPKIKVKFNNIAKINVMLILPKLFIFKNVWAFIPSVSTLSIVCLPNNLIYRYNAEDNANIVLTGTAPINGRIGFSLDATGRSV